MQVRSVSSGHFRPAIFSSRWTKLCSHVLCEASLLRLCTRQKIIAQHIFMWSYHPGKKSSWSIDRAQVSIGSGHRVRPLCISRIILKLSFLTHSIQSGTSGGENELHTPQNMIELPGSPFLPSLRAQMGGYRYEATFVAVCL